LNNIDSRVDSNMNGLISDLQLLIRQPSVSARSEGLFECANLVASMMTKAGIETEILCINDAKDGKKPVPPLVYGEINSKSNPTGKTLMFYNHYDVQPEDPAELWVDDPFSGKIEGNFVFGRGSADDKGELITRIKAVQYLLEETGDVPCNIKFVIEGEEEIGSIHLDDYLATYKNEFKCDGVIWEFGYVDDQDRPIISLGMKGLLYVELVAKGPVRDAHSSLAVLIENPAWCLIRALNTMRDETGRILIKDWYKEVREFTDDELSLVSNEPFDQHEFKHQYGIETFVNDATGIDISKALVGMPTCNIAGLMSGYTGKGAKTVLPANAEAKLDFRLIPDMEPLRQFQRLSNHLEENEFKNTIELRLIHAEPAARTAISDPLVKKIKECADEVYGESILSVSSAGTGPMYSFIKNLHAPCVSIGSTYIYSRIHSPNEYTRIDLLKKTTKCIAAITEKFAVIE
jgi:acetylornithine deacetylase/succinyl-diaminopimelate desuccinylase-like protein